MAEKKNEKQASVKNEVSISKIQVVGPADQTNGADILRFTRDGRKQPIDITAGQYLTVGADGDITPDEAQRLLNYSRWEVKEVKD